VALKHGKPVAFAAFSPDGQHVVTAGADNAARVWRASDGGAAAGPFQQAMPVLFAGFSRDGKRLVTCGGEVGKGRGEIHVWDLSGDKSARPLSLSLSMAIHQAYLTPDGKHVVGVGGRRLARLWELSTGKEVATVTGVHVDAEGIVSPDGSRALKLDGPSARVYNAATGLPVSPLLAHAEPVIQAGVSADGRRLTTRAKSGAGRAWDLAPDERPVEDLMRLTESLSGQTLDGKSGGFQPAAMTNLRQAWPKIRARYPQDFRPSPP
jgi:WD40 repeat protein